MSAGEHVAALSQRIVIFIVEILQAQLTIPVSGATLIGEKEIL
jgi:hypothetical protein